MTSLEPPTLITLETYSSQNWTVVLYAATDIRFIKLKHIF